MKLYLIRHGESIGNTKKGFISGQSDPDGLSRKGRIQIIRTAWELKDEKIDRIYVSPVHRAIETASIINLYKQLPLEVADWLTELHHGILEGNYWWDVMDQIPPEWKKQREDYATAYPGGGESMKGLVERVWDGYQQLIQSLDEDVSVALVSHQAVIGALMYCIEVGNPHDIKIDEQKKAFLEYIHAAIPPNGSITRVELSQGKKQLLEMQKHFESVEAKNEAVTFYIQGIIGKTEKPEIIPIQTSSGNSVYKLKLEDERYILKIYKDHEITSIQRLVKLYQYLEKNTEIEAPLILHYEKSHIFFQEATVLQDYKKGDEQGECLANCTESTQSILKQTYDIIRKVHAIPVEDVKDLWMTDDWEEKAHPTFQEYFKKEIRQTMDKVQQLTDISDTVKAGIKADLQELYQYLKESTICLSPLHGDLSPHNFVIQHSAENNGCMVIRILDFERARIGDSLWDYAYYYGWIQRMDADLAKQWKEIMWHDFSESQKKAFMLYWTLFHAWTIRDMVDYEGNATRKRRGERSRELLTQFYTD